MRRFSLKVWVGVIVGAAGIGWALVGYMSGAPGHPVESTAEHDAIVQSAPNAHDSRTEISRLDRRIDDMEARLRHAVTESGRDTRAVGSVTPDEDDSPQLTADEMLAEQEAQVQRHQDHLRTMISQQRPDDDWRWEITGSVQHAIASTGAPVELQSVVCSESLCEVVIEHSGPMDHQAVHFAAMDSEMPGMMGPALVRRRGVHGAYVTTMILGRPGGLLPPPPDS